MEALALLDTAAESRGFSASLMGVKHDQCRVYVIVDVKGKVPTSEEANAGTELVGDDTIKSVANDARKIFILVRLPQAPGVTAGAFAPISVASLPALAPEHHISQVVAQIRGGKVTVEVGGHLKLADELVWPNAANGLLYVRGFYAALFDCILKKCAPRAPTDIASHLMRHIITGQPGIGKTVFGWYIIYRLLKEQPERTIVYAKSDVDMVYIIPPNGPTRKALLKHFALSCLEDMSDLGTAPVLVADSFIPPVLPFATILITSSGVLAQPGISDRLNSFCGRRYVPVPTEEEILDMRSVAFPLLDEAGVRRRMQLWGPIIRFVLVKTDHQSQFERLTLAKQVPIEALSALVRGEAAGQSGEGDAKKAPHTLVHERAAGQDAEPGSADADPNREQYYHRGRVVIASESFALHIADRWAHAQRFDAARLVDASAGFGALGAVRGIKFEEIVVHLLSQGLKDIRMRDLKTGSLSNLNIAKAKQFSWSNVQELKGCKKRHAVPQNRNAAGLDALFWDPAVGHHWPLDATVSAQHGINADGLAAALNALGWTPTAGWPQALGHAASRKLQVKYFWAVPEDRFDEWTSEQKIKAGSSTSALAEQTWKHVAQFAICVPSASSLARFAQVLKDKGTKLPADLVRKDDVAELPAGVPDAAEQ